MTGALVLDEEGEVGPDALQLQDGDFVVVPEVDEGKHDALVVQRVEEGNFLGDAVGLRNSTVSLLISTWVKFELPSIPIFRTL